MYVMPGSAVARTPGTRVIRGAGVPRGVAVPRGAGVAVEAERSATSLSPGGWSGAAGFFGWVTTYAFAPTKVIAASSEAPARRTVARSMVSD